MKEIRCTYCRKYFLPNFGNVYWYRGCPFCSNSCRTSYCDKRLINRKGIKCFTLFFTLFVSALLFGLVESPNTSATSWTIDAFSIYQYSIPNSSLTGGLSLGEFRYDVTSTDGLNPRNSAFILSNYNSSTHKCDYNNYLTPGYQLGSTYISWGTGFVPNYSFDPSVISYVLDSSSNYLCRTMYSYGQEVLSGHSSIPEFNSSSIPLNTAINVNSMLPYNFMYNNIYFSPSNVIDGVYYTDSFDLSDMLNYRREVDSDNENYVYYSDIIKKVNLLLSTDTSAESLVSGTSVSFSGSVNFGAGLSSSEVSALSINFRLNSDNLHNVNIPCTLSYNDSSFVLSYECSSTLSYSYSKAHYNYNFIMSSGDSPFSSEKQSITFSSITYISNSDPSIHRGSMSFPTSGSYPNVAPGTPVPDSDNADWFSSLTNLFSFNIFNPFAPIFEMFTDNNQCADIPIIAGMLHSEETTYCPWFSPTTRNILSPVLGLASVMLLFGFFVRWLGSSSGNMFEDQTAHKWSNTQFKQKGS